MYFTEEAMCALREPNVKVWRRFKKKPAALSAPLFSALKLDLFHIDGAQFGRQYCAHLRVKMKAAMKRYGHLPCQLKSIQILQVVTLVTGQPSRVLSDKRKKKEKTLSQR